eukprot:scaffold7139_cov115-Cylindrotheca_fusiformis.AAC.2
MQHHEQLGQGHLLVQIAGVEYELALGDSQYLGLCPLICPKCFCPYDMCGTLLIVGQPAKVFFGFLISWEILFVISSISTFTSMNMKRGFFALFALGSRTHAFTLSSNRYFTSSLAMSKRVLVPIAEGSEEIETTCITDTLTRFGAEVTIASVMPGALVCKMSRGVKIMADVDISDAAKEEWDLIALPGGMPGAANLRDSDALIDLLKKQKNEGKPFAAICAAPAVVLASKGLLEVEGATCYPAPHFREKLINPTDSDVAFTAGSVTTSKGPGTALKFALELGEQLFGKEARDKIQNEMLA